MALTRFTKDMAVVQKLDDEPNDVGGLTAAQLKAKFDEGGEALKEYLNGTLLPELQGGAAAASLGATLRDTAMTVQQALDTLEAAGVQGGNLPVGGQAGELLRKSSDGLFDAGWSPLIVSVPFTAEEWVQDGGEGTYVLTIPQAVHKRTGPGFTLSLRHLVDGVLTDHTWACLGTQSRYDAETGDVKLSGGDAYAGQALFIGP